MGEDVNSVSPTLGFIIKTVEFERYCPTFPAVCSRVRSLIVRSTDTNSTSVRGTNQRTCFELLTLPLGDVGGQKTLRTYWKNYFERTDTVAAQSTVSWECDEQSADGGS